MRIRQSIRTATEAQTIPAQIENRVPMMAKLWCMMVTFVVLVSMFLASPNAGTETDENTLAKGRAANGGSPTLHVQNDDTATTNQDIPNDYWFASIVQSDATTPNTSPNDYSFASSVHSDTTTTKTSMERSLILPFDIDYIAAIPGYAIWYIRLTNSFLWDDILTRFFPCDNRKCINKCSGCGTDVCVIPPGSWFGQCQANPSSFRDVTENVLPPYTQTAPPFLDPLKTPMPAGVCTLDVDNDGIPDLYFVSGQDFPNALMRNTGMGQFENVSEEWKLTLSESSAVSCLSADLDNDGCEDLVLTGAYTGGDFSGNLLLRNTYCDDGNAGFEDMTPDILRQWPYSVSSSAADIDNDGLLDIYVSALPALDLSNFPGAVPIENFPGSSLLLHNLGSFRFADITPGSGVGNPTCPCISIFLDYDRDGMQDIVAVNCGNDIVRTFSMQLYRNRGNLTFEDVSAVAGFGPDDPRGMWMGAGVGDFNQDGCLDFAATNLGFDVSWPDSDPYLFLGKCNGETVGFVGERIVPEPRPFTLDSTYFAWGPMARDFNNDGILDMFWSGNYLVYTLYDDIIITIINFLDKLIPRPSEYTEAEVLYGNGPTEDYKFTAVPLPTDLRQDYHIIMTSGDYNGDGALDIVIAIDNSVPGPRNGRPAIFYGTHTENNWLGIRLVGTSNSVNRQGIGALLHLYKDSADHAEQTSTLLAGSGSMSTEEKTVFFGVGSENVNQYQLRVLWPGGAPEWFGPFNENGVVTVTEGSGALERVQ